MQNMVYRIIKITINSASRRMTVYNETTAIKMDLHHIPAEMTDALKLP